MCTHWTLLHAPRQDARHDTTRDSLFIRVHVLSTRLTSRATAPVPRTPHTCMGAFLVSRSRLRLFLVVLVLRSAPLAACGRCSLSVRGAAGAGTCVNRDLPCQNLPLLQKKSPPEPTSPTDRPSSKEGRPPSRFDRFQVAFPSLAKEWGVSPLGPLQQVSVCNSFTPYQDHSQPPSAPPWS